jgi:FkbM family methyltransferase
MLTAAARALARSERVARLVLPLPRLVRRRGLRSKLFRTFSWPLSEGVRAPLAVRTAAGSLSVDPATPIGRVLAVSGEWEPHVTEAFRGRLGTGDVCVDVGAHVGYYTLLASTLVGPTGHVYAFEPVGDVYETLRVNVARNDARNVSTFAVAAGSEEGTGVLLRAPGASPLTSSLSPRMLESPHGARSENFVATEVPVVAVDDVLPADSLPRVRVVKIDVEGHEVEVLRGMERLLGVGARIAVFVEVSPQWAGTGVGQALDEVCRSHGLSPYRLSNEYTLEGYFPARIVPPVPVSTIPAERCDLMLIRDGGPA